jgi:hypothetical protein
LIALIANAHSSAPCADGGIVALRFPRLDLRIMLIPGSLAESSRQTDQLASSVFGRPGGSSGEPEPDPIPNSAVKLPSADGTKSQDLEE